MDYIITNHLTEQEAKDMLKDAAQDYRLTLEEVGMIFRLLNSSFVPSYYSTIRKKLGVKYATIDKIMKRLATTGYCRGMYIESPNGDVELYTLTPYYKVNQ
jgi:DNA-binding MarR family transcriptional regulator